MHIIQEGKMYINPMTSYKNNFNFRSRINFIPIKDKYDVERAANVYASYRNKKSDGLRKTLREEYEKDKYIPDNSKNQNEPAIVKLIQNMAEKLLCKTQKFAYKSMEKMIQAENRISSLSGKLELVATTKTIDEFNLVELVEKENDDWSKTIMGMYQMIHKKNNSAARIAYVLADPKIKYKSDMKDFLLAIGDRIYERASSNNIRYLVWYKKGVDEPILSNLCKKRFRYQDDPILQKILGKDVFIVRTDDFKRSIDEYRNKH